MTHYEYPANHTAEEWETKARECSRRSQESYERCGSDGYLSQWASDMTAGLYFTCAKVARNGNVWDFEVLADADGNIIEGARLISSTGLYGGYVWRYRTTDGRTHWFNPSQASSPEKRAANNLKKGYTFVTVTRPARVHLEGNLTLYSVITQIEN